MVLLHGGSPRGAERIAACWADHRKVPQVVFKPDWTRDRNAAPFKRNDRMLEALPIGVVVFPGSGIAANLADKAKKLDAGELAASHNTVLVLDEVSQIAPRPMLKLLELQARTGITIKLLGDREQAQAIEAGDAIEILRRALPPEALPELLTTMRQITRRGREIAGRFRDGDATTALAIKRQDGHAILVGGDHDQVVGRIADLYIGRRDLLTASGAKRGITVSAPTNDDVAEISRAIRERLKHRGEIGDDEIIHQAVDQDGRTYDLPIANGDRVRLFRRIWGTVDGQACRVGNNGDIAEVLGWSAAGLRLRTKDGHMAEVEWRRLRDSETGRLLLGFGHALTINAAQGITSDEHINALPRGTSGVTAFTSYTAESRSRGTTWTIISEAAVYETERYRQALGDITPITRDDLWARVAEDMSHKPYKALGIDLLAAAQRGREQAVDTVIACHLALETAQRNNPNFGRDALQRLRARALNNALSPQLGALHRALAEDGALIRDIVREQEADTKPHALPDEAAAANRQIDTVEADRPRQSTGPGF